MSTDDDATLIRFALLEGLFRCRNEAGKFYCTFVSGRAAHPARIRTGRRPSAPRGQPIDAGMNGQPRSVCCSARPSAPSGSECGDDGLPSHGPRGSIVSGEEMYLVPLFVLPIGDTPNARGKTSDALPIATVDPRQGHKAIAIFLDGRMSALNVPDPFTSNKRTGPQHPRTLRRGRRGEGEEGEHGDEDAGPADGRGVLRDRSEEGRKGGGAL